jgi:hypothetical protein
MLRWPFGNWDRTVDKTRLHMPMSGRPLIKVTPSASAVPSGVPGCMKA